MKTFYLRQSLDLSREEIEDAIRARVQTVPLGDGVVLARVLGRFKMYLRTDDLGFAAHVMLDGFWESWLTRFLAGLARPGMVCVDVGANFGYHSLTLADAAGPSGRLYAFEPNPQAVELLGRTIVLNGFGGTTTIRAEALGDEAQGTVGLAVPAGEPKNAHVVPAEGAVLRVPATTLDAALAHETRIDLVKIDAEGAEEAIVAGAATILSRDRPHLVLEFNALRARDPRALLDRLLAIYGAVRRIDFDGSARTVKAAAIHEDRSGEDQLLYFAR